MAIDAPSDPVFRVVMVCYANLCRSPMMESIARQLADARGLNWELTSVGVEAQEGMRMHRHAQSVLGARGITVTDWRTRRATGERLSGADLVLTATEATRDGVIRIHPQTLTRAYTLLHFAHLVRDVGHRSEVADFGPWLREQAYARRNGRQPMPRKARDIADPIGYPRSRFRQCGDVIEEALEIVFEPLPGDRWSWRSQRGS